MNNYFKAVCVIFVLFVSQTAYSQLLYPIDDKKGEYLPPYNPNVVIISPDVKKWMEAESVKETEKKTVEMKRDVLGRVKSSTDNTGQGTVKVVDNKQKRLVVVSDMHIPQIEMEPIQARYTYNPETKDYDYSLNGKKVSAKEYGALIKNYNEKYYSYNRDKRNLSVPGVISSDSRSWTAWMTAEEIEELTKKYKELAISDYVEPEPTASIASILSNIQISTHAFPRGYDGNGIGVYVMEPGCRDINYPIYKPNGYTDNCTGGNTSIAYKQHHSMVVNVVQHAAPSAHIFGFKTSSSFPNPDSYSPAIEIGNHSYAWLVGTLYSDEDMKMDNYIYNNRVINFVAAGNKNINDTTSNIASPGRALNAITVGAVKPSTNMYASSSKWKNSEVSNEKPEIAMYTDINMGTYSYNSDFNGTSAAAPLATGFTASLLEQHPFFRRQPALMKAVLLTGETTPITNANSHDMDNVKLAKAITNYSSVALWKSRSAWWSGGNSAHFDSNKEIKFIEDNIQANKRYKIAISWLVPGNYIKSNKKPPQDIDLYVYQNGVVIASLVSSRNSYEIVDFTTTSNAPLTIRIYRYSNSGTGDVLLGYHMREDI